LYYVKAGFAELYICEYLKIIKGVKEINCVLVGTDVYIRRKKTNDQRACHLLVNRVCRMITMIAAHTKNIVVSRSESQVRRAIAIIHRLPGRSTGGLVRARQLHFDYLCVAINFSR